ncbi:MAG: TolC family protein [Ignavibacteriae bacterium]|nr:TolC family protein [Ignavibacteriota bacterium]
MRKVLLALLAFLLTNGTTTAQKNLPLSVEKAIQLALDNSKSLHASLMRVNYADAKSSEVNASRLPSVKFGGAYTRLSDVPPFAISLPASLAPVFGVNSFTLAPTIANNYTIKATLEQPIFTGFRLGAAANAAEYSARAAEQDHAKDKSELIYNVKQAYWSLFKAMEFKKVVDENVEQVKAHLNDVQNLLDQGMATTNDLLKVQVQLSDAQLRQIEMNNNVQLATIGLNNVIGIPLQTQLTLESDMNNATVAQPSDLNTLVEKATTQRSELKAMEYRVKAAESGITAAKGSWWPQVFLNANYYYNRPNQRIQPMQDIFKDTWDVSIGVSLDIWNWGKTLHQTDQASAQYEEAKDALDQLKDGIALETTQTYLNLNQSKERTAVADKGVKQAEENYRVTNRRFKEGLAQNSDLLDAEVALLQAKTNYTQALVDYELAQARLQKVLGE